MPTLEARMTTTATGSSLQSWEAGSGAPALYLHGFTGHPGADNRFLTALSGTRRVIAPDLPGFGASDEMPELEDLLDTSLWVRDFIRQAAGQPVDLIGHSMGALIAADAALVSPHLVRKLVLVNPFGLWLDASPMADPFTMTPGELRRATSGVDSPAPDGSSGPPTPDALLQRYKNLGAASQYLWPIPDRGLRKRARYIEAPTLAIFGDRDGLIPAPYREAFARAIPGCQVEVLQGGHLLPEQQADDLLSLVQAFLG